MSRAGPSTPPLASTLATARPPTSALASTSTAGNGSAQRGKSNQRNSSTVPPMDAALELSCKTVGQLKAAVPPRLKQLSCLSQPREGPTSSVNSMSRGNT
ncbi:hypothetical protein V8E36_001453 [Tilletia maclaganii]